MIKLYLIKLFKIIINYESIINDLLYIKERASVFIDLYIDLIINTRLLLALILK